MKFAHLLASAMAITCGLAVLGGCQSIQGIGNLPSGDGGSSATPVPGNPACANKGVCSAFETTVPTAGQRACLPQGQCTPTDATSLSPKWAPPSARSETCTDTQIDEAFAVCLGNTATEEAACEEWFANVANKACAGCLRSSPGVAPSGAFIAYGAFAQVNQAGCVALSAPCNDSCARAIGAATDCRHQVCDTKSGGNCDPLSGVNDNDVARCFSRAGEGPNCGCSEFVATAQACYAKLDAATQALCNANTEADFRRIAKFMCGPCTN